MNALLYSLVTFIDLMSLSALVGAVLCSFWTMCPACEDSRTNPLLERYRVFFLFFWLAVLSVSSIGVLAQRAMVMAGLGIMEIAPVLPTVLTGSHYGSMWLLRASGIVIAWLVLLIGKRHLNSGIVSFLLVLACVAAAFSRSASSHAADHGDFSLQELSDWFHLLASIVWGGSLISLSLMFAASKVAEHAEQQHIVSAVADRFYAIFGPVFAIIVFTGLYNAWVEVGSFGVLLRTTYGRFLSIKLIIFACLAARYIVSPQRGSDEAADAIKFIKRIRVEACLILTILLCVALFTQEIPARHAVHMMLIERENKKEINLGTGFDQEINKPVESGQDGSLSKMTGNGLYFVEMVLQDKELTVGVNSFDVTIRDKNGRGVSGAKINVVPWMPEMGHGVFEKPVVNEKGGGKYNIDNVILIMGGRWDLRLTIRKNKAEDAVTFKVQVS